MDINLLPYTARDGIPTLTDSAVKGFFEQMVEDDTAKDVFVNGPVASADEFLKIMKFGTNSLYVVMVDKNVSGIVWLNDFKPRSASFHFCFFSNVWGEDTVKIGKQCVLNLLHMKSGNGEYDFDLLTGFVPERNEKAIKWCREMRAEELGRLPCSAWIAEEQKSEAGIIFYVERGKYHG